MEKVRVNSVKVGQAFSEPLFTDRGRKLVGAGVVLTERGLEALQRNRGAYVYAAANVNDLVDAGVLKRSSVGATGRRTAGSARR